jgi:hypothetical protein
MTILTRDETEHDTEYVLASEARQEIDNQLMQVLKNFLTAYELRHALGLLLEEYDDRRSQYGTDYLWQKHEDQDAIRIARDTHARTATSRPNPTP